MEFKCIFILLVSLAFVNSREIQNMSRRRSEGQFISLASYYAPLIDYQHFSFQGVTHEIIKRQSRKTSEESNEFRFPDDSHETEAPIIRSTVKPPIDLVINVSACLKGFK